MTFYLNWILLFFNIITVTAYLKEFIKFINFKNSLFGNIVTAYSSHVLFFKIYAILIGLVIFIILTVYNILSIYNYR